MHCMELPFVFDHPDLIGFMTGMGPERYELAKMAVATTHRRRGIGEMLGAAGVDWVAEQGGRSVFLQSNTKLANALRLYERLGFRRALDPNPTEYARCDIYMELPIAARGG